LEKFIPNIMAVDLAARYSAAVRMSYTEPPYPAEFQVTSSWNSWKPTEMEFVHQICSPFSGEPTLPSKVPEVMLIEDLPHGLKFAALVKRVCRLQGRIVELMEQYGHRDKILFVPPALWQRYYKRVADEKWPDAVVPVAERHGYKPPNLVEEGMKAVERNTAKKVMTDYCASYLIGFWGLAQLETHGTFDIEGTQRYTDKVTPPRKKKV
jgi:hypothetical protein